MKTYLYYHICQLGDWQRVAREQLRAILDSGLYDAVDGLYVGVLGPSVLVLPEKCEIVYTSPDVAEAELPTLDHLHQRAMEEDFTVLYLHTKGVSSGLQGKNPLAQQAWRKYMEYFVVGQWQRCLSELQAHDAVGVQWSPRTPTHNGHYSGNFWWARSDYLRTLPQVYDVELLPPHNAHPRMRAEFWLGSRPDIRAKSLFQYPGNLYHEVIDPALYQT